MKLTMLIAVAAVSAFASDAPRVDADTQIEVLATQLAVISAQQAATPYLDALKKAQADAAPALERAQKQCGDKHEPSLVEKKVVCKLKPELQKKEEPKK